VVPSERDQIATANALRKRSAPERRFINAVRRVALSHASQHSSRTAHRSPTKVSSPTAITKSIKSTLQAVSGIRPLLIPPARKERIEVIDIPTTETQKATNIDESELKDDPTTRHVNATNTIDEHGTITPTPTTTAMIEKPANVEEVTTTVIGPTEVPPVPTIPIATDEVPQALLMMATPASIVDVPLPKPPLVRPEEEIRDVAVGQDNITDPTPTDREVVERAAQLPSQVTTKTTTTTMITNKRLSPTRSPSPSKQRAAKYKSKFGGRGRQG
jgi:hypothetical protein